MENYSIMILKMSSLVKKVPVVSEVLEELHQEHSQEKDGYFVYSEFVPGYTLPYRHPPSQAKKQPTREPTIISTNQKDATKGSA